MEIYVLKKILKTEITNCKECPHSSWLPGKDKWELWCDLLNVTILRKGQKYPIPEQCTLDDASNK